MLDLFSVVFFLEVDILLFKIYFKVSSLKTKCMFAVIQETVYFLIPAQFVVFSDFFPSCMVSLADPSVPSCVRAHRHIHIHTHNPQASVLVVILTSSRNRIIGRGPLTWGRRKSEI